MSFSRHASYGRPNDLLHHLGVHRIGHHRGGGVGTHTAGIGSGVAFANTLVVLGRGHRQYVFTVDHDDKAGFLTFQKALQYDPGARVAKLIIGEHVLNRCLGFIERRGDDDALSRGEAIGFDDDRCALLSHVSEGGLDLGKDGVGRCRYIVPGKEILGKRLAALELCCTRGRAEAGEALFIEVINNACNQWRLGTDHREGTVIFLSKGR